MCAQVKVTRKGSETEDEKFIRFLDRGDFFGEKALRGYLYFLFFPLKFLLRKEFLQFYSCVFREEKRTANIVADDKEGVSCLVLDREYVATAVLWCKSDTRIFSRCYRVILQELQSDAM